MKLNISTKFAAVNLVEGGEFYFFSEYVSLDEKNIILTVVIKIKQWVRNLQGKPVAIFRSKFT